MGVSTINPVNLLPAVPGIVLGIAMLVIARSERIARERAGVETAEERPAGKISAAITAVCEQASPQLSVQEAKIVWVATATLPALVALTLGLGAISLVLLPLGAVGFPIYLKVRRDSSMKKFEEQLGQAMPLIASNLRAGSSVAQAIGPVAENMSDPIKSEFRRLTSDIRAGTPVPEALDKVADRTGSRDLRLFSTAVDISQQTGGSLADITENVGQTVRARRGPQDHPLQDLAEPHRVADHGRPAHLHDGRAPHDLAGSPRVLQPALRLGAHRAGGRAGLTGLHHDEEDGRHQARLGAR